MSTDQWIELLRDWGSDILKDPNRVRSLPKSLADRESGWIGYPPASQSDILKATSRLGAELPPSYMDFLMATNGWPAAGPFTDVILPVQEIERFSRKSPEWLESWRLGVSYVGGLAPVSDEDYSVYGEDQNPLLIRDEYLDDAVQISEGDIAVYLLNPKVVFKDGEWEAWVFEAETGARRFRSFWDLMLAEYESFLRLKDSG